MVKPKVLDGIVLAYGIFLIVMGVIGYVVGHHFMSLVGGAGAGILVLVFLAITGKHRQVGRIGVAVVALGMMGMFGGNIVKRLTAAPSTAPQTAIWQAYVIATVSLLVFLALGLGHMAAMRERRLE